MSGSHHHHGYFDPYSRIRSPVHDLPTSLKMFVAIGWIIAIVATPVTATTLVTFFPVAILFLAIVSGLSFVPPGFVFRRMLVLEPVVLGVAGLALFQPNGLVVFLTLALRSTLCLTTSLLLANTTPFSDMLAVMRRLRTPALLVNTMALMYRYLYVIGSESQRMRRARSSRTFSASRRLNWAMLATTVGQLFVRAADRADRIYIAMASRGWR